MFKKILVFFAGLIVVAIIASFAAYLYYLNQIQAPIGTGTEEPIKLTIEKGMGVEEISAYLKEEGLIQNPLILKAYLFLNKDKFIQAGYYSIDPEGLNLIKLVDLMQNGSFERKLTFIEGWRVAEYGDYLAREVNEEFAEQFMNSSYIKEGYMFPDTYTIEEGYEPENLASFMRNTFDKRVTNELIDQAAFRGLSLDQVVILASLVEREMNIKKDRPIVAGIIIKRLNNGWALNVDATIQYAKGNENDWWPTVTRNDYTNVNSPYNTYRVKGLPPGPIANPGLDAITAVVNYQESPYWFYVTGNDGVTHYAETLEQHNLNVERYLK